MLERPAGGLGELRRAGGDDAGQGRGRLGGDGVGLAPCHAQSASVSSLLRCQFRLPGGRDAPRGAADRPHVGPPVAQRLGGVVQDRSADERASGRRAAAHRATCRRRPPGRAPAAPTTRCSRMACAICPAVAQRDLQGLGGVQPLVEQHDLVALDAVRAAEDAARRAPVRRRRSGATSAGQATERPLGRDGQAQQLARGCARASLEGHGHAGHLDRRPRRVTGERTEELAAGDQLGIIRRLGRGRCLARGGDRVRRVGRGVGRRGRVRPDRRVGWRGTGLHGRRRGTRLSTG